MNVRELLAARPLLFDGAMGTYFASQSGEAVARCETACLDAPERIYRIHREYLDAGADAIKTDTFAANELTLGSSARAAAVVDAAVALARRAVRECGREAAVFADLGPVYPATDADADPAALYCRTADLFLDRGVENFLFETMSRPEGLAEACAHIRRRCPSAFVCVTFAVAPDGFTRAGHAGAALCRSMAAEPAVDAVGFNCLSGPSHLAKLAAELGPLGKPLAVMPNAGYPTRVESRTFFGGSASYFAEAATRILSAGASLIGGCCGTTPEFIRALRGALDAGAASTSPAPHGAPEARRRARPAVWEKSRCIAVELDPPDNAEIGGFLSGAAAICAAGADAITIADCPISRARADSSLLAAKLHRELGLTAIPHLTCRDRNLNATKALLLGLGIEGVEHVLVVTGDPVPSDERGYVKRVYNFSSPRLAAFIRDLGASESGARFSVAGALNVNVANFDAQLRHAEEKQRSGVTALFTQPVMTEEALRNLERARRALDVRLLCGIMPIVSHRNALYMDAEISGMRVDPRIIALYEGLDRAAGEALAERICAETARAAAPFCDGYYIITPFRRVELVSRIVAALRQAGGDGK